MRFRRSGRNWQGRNWVLCPALQTLATQIERKFPDPHPTDGTVAGMQHDLSSPSSDHRPWEWSDTIGAVVNAIDIGDNDKLRLRAVADAIVESRDDRMKYMIHAGEIVRSYNKPGVPAWTWDRYAGPSPHNTHLHVSVPRGTNQDTRPWTIEERRMVLKPGDEGKAVERLQEFLQRLKLYTSGDIDGIYGAKTATAVRAFQKRPEVDLDQTGEVDDVTWGCIIERLAATELAPKGHTHKEPPVPPTVPVHGHDEYLTDAHLVGEISLELVRGDSG